MLSLRQRPQAHPVWPRGCLWSRVLSPVSFAPALCPAGCLGPPMLGSRCATRDPQPTCGIRGSCVSPASLSPNSTHSPSFWPVPDLSSAPAFSVPRFSRLFWPRDPDHGKATEWPHAHPWGPTRARPHPSPGIPAAHREEEEEEETKPLGARQPPCPKAGNQAPAPVLLALPEEGVPA